MRALLVTHGELGDALLESARLIYAVEAPISVLSNAALGLEDLVVEIRRWLDRGSGPALIMVDVGGGSCGVAARAAAKGRPETWLLGGVNLPMVLTYLSHHGQVGSDDLLSRLLDRAHNAVDVLETDG
jgi:mannose/fructose-specific phosphotransferase system component IIA